MEAAEGMKKAVADRKASQVKALKVLDAAVKESQANLRRRR
ncbi:unnamed protein product, partial [marine sediment metagenome]